MNIHYKIVEVWPDDHLMVARYWTDVLTEEMLAGDANRNSDGTPVRCRTDVAINIPIPVPTGKELDVFIKRNAPLGWLKMMEDVKNPDVNTDASHVSSLLHVSKTTTMNEIEEITKPLSPTVQQNRNTGKLTEEDIQQLIDNIKTS
jgi:hypothetical protein